MTTDKRIGTMLTIAGSALVAVGAAIAVACADGPVGPGAQRGFEVWVMDQSPSPGKTWGGRIFIYQSAAHRGGSQILETTPETIDLGGATTALCQASTGAAPVQAHNVTFTRTHSHAIVAFLASGHVAILDAAARAPVACLQMSLGAMGMRHAHQAVASPDGSYILVANQMGKLVERIDANFATNTFTLNTAATINLATCTTPSGAACEAAGIRPNNQPVTATINEGGDLAFITMRGGGFFAIDPRSTPMRIRAEYDISAIAAQGLASIRAGDDLFATSGANSFRVYRFPLSGFSSAAANAPNVPAPSALVSDATAGRDGHGMTLSKNAKYLWVSDRGGNIIEIFNVATGVRETPLTLAGTLSADPSPDLLATSPSGDVVFVTLKGPNPLSGIPWGTGSTPGLGIITIDQDGRSGHLTEILPITNKDANGVERADPHGLVIRRK
jgi:DNA-binding beta-propeller fold protein YncE